MKETILEKSKELEISSYAVQQVVGLGRKLGGFGMEGGGLSFSQILAQRKQEVNKERS